MNARQIHRLRKKISKYHLYAVFITDNHFNFVEFKVYAPNIAFAIKRYMRRYFIKNKRYPTAWRCDGLYREVSFIHGEIGVEDEKGFTHYFI